MLLAKLFWRYIICGMTLVPLFVLVSFIVITFVFGIDFSNEEQTDKFDRMLFSNRIDLYCESRRNRNRIPNIEVIATRLLWCILIWPAYIPLLCIKIGEIIIHWND